MADDSDKKDTEAKKVVHTYPLVRHSDMADEMKTEAMELCVTACEKFSNNNEIVCVIGHEIFKAALGQVLVQLVIQYGYITFHTFLFINYITFHKFRYQMAAKMIKDTMDKKFGASWHIVVGEGYGYEMTHEIKSCLYMFFGGTTGILMWKCS